MSQQEQTNDIELLGIDKNSDATPSPMSMTEVNTPPLPPVDGCSAAGTAWIAKATHPPSAVPGYVGMPTEDSRVIANLDWRHLSINDTPLIDGTGPTPVAQEPDTDTMGYISTSGARVHAIGILYDNSIGAMRQDVANTVYNDSYAFKNFHQDANLYRLAYKSISFYPNATEFNDTGLTTSCQFNPSILFGGLLLRFYETADINQVRSFHTSKAAYNHRLPFVRKNGADPADTLVISKADAVRAKYSRSTRNQLIDDMPKIGLDPDANVQLVQFNGTASGIPSVPEINQWSPRAYSGKYRDGIFTVTKQNSIAQPYRAASNSSNLGASNGGLYQCYYQYVGDDGVNHTVAFLENMTSGQASASAIILTDTLWCDTTWSVTLFSGLTQQFASSGTVFSSRTFNLLIRKVYSGFEIQPSPRSAWSAVSKLAPEPDICAMQKCQKVFFEMKDAMPVKYNFLGTIAIGAAKRVGRALVNRAKNSTARALNGAADSVAAAVQQRGANPRPAPRRQRPRRAAIEGPMTQEASLESERLAELKRQLAAANRKLKQLNLASTPPVRTRRRRRQTQRPSAPPRGAPRN